MNECVVVVNGQEHSVLSQIKYWQDR